MRKLRKNNNIDIIEDNLLGDMPDISVISAAQEEMRSRQKRSRSISKQQKRAIISACTCLILCITAFCISIPFWAVNKKQPDVFLQKNLIKSDVITDISAFCEQNEIEAMFLTTDDSAYYAFSSKYGKGIMLMLQDGVIDDTRFNLYVVDNGRNNYKIENVNDNLPDMNDEIIVNDITMRYTIAEDKIIATFSHDGYDYFFYYYGVNEKEFLSILNLFLQ